MSDNELINIILWLELIIIIGMLLFIIGAAIFFAWCWVSDLVWRLRHPIKKRTAEEIEHDRALLTSLWSMPVIIDFKDLPRPVGIEDLKEPKP